jgi:hypothetical protein
MAAILAYPISYAQADINHHLIRRVAVFPLRVSGVSNTVLDEAWWKAREELTRNQRFLVAGRRFMQNRDVFQPRAELKVADAVILGRILDSHALITYRVDGHQFKIMVYDGENGFSIWQSEISLHPAIPVADQLVAATVKLTRDFIMQIPYQAFQIVDQGIGKAVYEEEGVHLAKVFIGSNSYLQSDDAVEWIQVSGDPTRTILGNGSKVEVIAQGTVVNIEDDIATVAIEKARSIEELKEGSLIRFPKEVERLRSNMKASDKETQLASQFAMAEMRDVSQLSGDQSSTTTSLAVIANLVAMILIAF